MDYLKEGRKECDTTEKFLYLSNTKKICKHN